MKKFIFIFFSFIYIIIFFNKDIFANEIKFTAEPLLDDINQTKDGYFKYNLVDSKKVVISVKITNKFNHRIKVSNKINDAINYKGNIIYKDVTVSKQKTKLTNMVMGNRKEVVTLNPNSSKVVSFVIKTPPKDKKYLSIGGVTSSIKTNVGKINYTTSILLKQNIDKFKVNKVDIKKFTVSKNKGSFKLYNNQNNILLNSNLNIKILKNNKLVRNETKKNYNMLPNSNNKINLSELNLKPGKYDLIVKISSNNETKKVKKIYFYKIMHKLLVFIFLSVFFISVIVIFFIVKQENNNDKKNT